MNHGIGAGKPSALPAAAVACLLLLACSPATPVLSGGSTTPAGRSDVAVGGAYRFPLGELAQGEVRDAFESEALEAGPVPVVRYRYGFSPEFDAGVTVVGPALSADGRYTLWVDEAHSLRPAFSLGANATAGLFSEGFRFGAGVVPLFALSATSLLEVWLGPKLALDGVSTGDAHGSVSARGFSAGGVFGLGAGFRNVHVLMELAVVHEWWDGSSATQDLQFSGVSLTPAFALRVRL